MFLLCAPSDHQDDVPITIRSRCRVVPLRTPPPDAIAEVLVEPRRDRPGHRELGGVGVRRPRRPGPPAGPRPGGPRAPRDRARPAAADARPGRRVRLRRRPGARREGRGHRAEREPRRSPSARSSPSPWAPAGTGKGVAAAARGAKAAERELERRQKSRNTRTQRDAIDRALVDLAGFFRDALVVGSGAAGAADQPRPRGRHPAGGHRVARRSRCCAGWRPCWPAAPRWTRTSSRRSPSRR